MKALKLFIITILTLSSAKGFAFTCEMKTDYDPSISCSNQSFVAKNQADLDAYAVDFGLKNGKYRNLRIDFDVTGTDLEVHSPCELLVRPNKVLNLDNLCLDGREEVQTGSNVEIQANFLGILSENGDADVGNNNIFTLNELRVESLKTTSISNNTQLQISGTVNIISNGNGADSVAELLPNAVVNANTLNILSGNIAKLGDNSESNIVGNFQMEAPVCEIKPDAVINAGSTSGSCLGGGPVDEAPLAITGVDQTVAVGSNVILDGTASRDSEGSPLTYNWTLTSKPMDSVSVIADPTSPRTNFTVDVAGDYIFELVVNDGTQDSLADTLIISTLNSRPLAIAGSDETIVVGQVVNLDGTNSIDPDQDTLTFLWNLVERPSTSAAVLDDSISPTPSFTADVSGDYVIELIVNDGIRDSKPARVVFSTINSRPLANAGDDVTAFKNQLVTLDAIESNDPDGDVLSFSWTLISKPAGSTATLATPDQQIATFTPDILGLYIAQVTVNDGNTSSSDVVVIDLINRAPVANANLSAEVLEPGDIINFDGNTSTDPDGDALTFNWQILEKPINSNASFDNANSATPSLLVDVAGLYRVSLTVNDGDDDSVAFELSFRGNNRPIANAGIVQSARLGETVVTDGSGSSDIDGDILTFSWRLLEKPVGSLSDLGNALTENANIIPDKEGLYRFELIVNDGLFDSSPATIELNATRLINSAPVLDPIGSHEVTIGSTLGLMLNAFDPDNNNINFSIAPLPNRIGLPKGMKLDGATGEFIFKPSPEQAGEVISITFQASDGFSMVEETISITVKDGLGGSTSISGRVLDANATVDGVTIPIIGAKVSLIGTNLSAITSGNGEFTISDIPVEVLENPVIKIDSSLAQNSPEGRRYADFAESIVLIPGVLNEFIRPFFLPSLNPNGGGAVQPGTRTELNNDDIFIKIEVPADNTMNPDGTPFIGEMNVSEVPANLAPVELPEGFNPAALYTLQPAGILFEEPIAVTFPNLDRLLPGAEVEILSLNPESGRFEIVGVARVSSDGSVLETISGGLPSASWFAPANRPSMPEKPPGDNKNENKNNNKKKNCPCSSSLNIEDGSFLDDHRLVSYRRAGRSHSLTFSYHSISAHPSFVAPTSINADNNLSQPTNLSFRFIVNGVTLGQDFYMDTSDLSTTEAETFDQNLLVDTSELPTGIYDYDIQYVNEFAASSSTFTFKDFVSDGSYTLPVVNLKNSAYGAGWRINEIHRIVKRVNGDVMLIHDNSAFVIFKLEGDVYRTPRGEFSTLVQQNDGSFLRTLKNGTRYLFNANGLMQSMVDRNGNKTSVVYLAGTDLIEYVEDPTGGRLSFSYGADNKLDSITDPAGRVTSFEIDSRGDLTRIIDPDLSDRLFNYNDTHGIISKVGKETFVDNGGGEARVSVTLSPLSVERPGLTNRYKSMIKRFSADEALNKQDKGQSRSLARAYVPGLVRNIPAERESAIRGNPIRISRRGEKSITYTDGNNNVTTLELNAFGAPVSILDAENRETAFITDINNLVTVETNGEGVQVRSLYDLKGNLTTRLVGGDPLNQQRVDISYDSEFSQVTSVRDTSLNITRFELDERGNVIRAIDPQGNVTELVYNTRGQVTRILDAEGNTTQLAYEPITGHLSKVIDPQGNITLTTYNAAGDVKTITDPKGKLTSFDYDNQGRVTRSVNANSEETLFDYDLAGNLLEVIDSRTGKTQFKYDGLGRVIERIDPLGKSEFFIYDPEDNLLSKTDRLGREILFEYNKVNELVKKTFPDGSEVNFSYDQAGRLKTVIDDSSNLSFTYDDKGQVKTVSTNGSPFQPDVTLTNVYDLVGNRTALQGLGKEIVYGFDQLNRINRLTSLSNGVFDFFFDKNGRRSALTRPNGVVTGYEYDEVSRLTKLSHFRASDLTTVASFSYGYDKNGNRDNMQTVREGISNIVSDITYGYDDINQLTSASAPIQGDQDESFVYDDLGNRLRKSGDTADAIYDGNNRLVENESHSFSYDDNGNQVSRTDKVSGEVIRYVWNIENELVTITTHLNDTAPASKTVSYKYDALGRRVLKDVDGVVISYVYDNEDILFEFDGSGNLIAEYTHGPGIDEPLEMTRNNETLYYHQDGLGSVTTLSDNLGAIKQSYVYDSFGKVRLFDQNGAEINLNNGIINPYGYTGRELDPESDLYYYRARYYNPEVGRFISADPIGFLGEDFNLYRYVTNNPTNNIDPFGLQQIKSIGDFFKELLKAHFRDSPEANARKQAELELILSGLHSPEVIQKFNSFQTDPVEEFLKFRERDRQNKVQRDLEDNEGFIRDLFDFIDNLPDPDKPEPRKPKKPKKRRSCPK